MFYQTNYSNDIYKTLSNVESFEIIKENTLTKVTEGKFFYSILSNLKEIFYFSDVLPALGVSLHDETLNTLKTGTWLKINFNKTLIVNDLPFDSLVFRLENIGGINLIRMYENKYSGRCIYVNFDHEINLTQILNN